MAPLPHLHKEASHFSGLGPFLSLDLSENRFALFGSRYGRGGIFLPFMLAGRVMHLSSQAVTLV